MIRKSEETKTYFDKLNLNQTNIVELNSIEKIDIEKPDESKLPISEMLLITIYLLAFLTLLTVLKLSNLYRPEKNLLVTYRYTNKIPCKNCLFFNSNHYLKCAVHPDKALKPVAVNCHDYHPRNNIYD